MRQWFDREVNFLCELKQNLDCIKKWEAEEQNREIDEIDLKELLDVMVRKTAGVVDGIEALNVLANYNIEGYKEHNDEDRREEDMELKDSTLQGVEDEKEKEDKKKVKITKRRNLVLEQR